MKIKTWLFFILLVALACGAAYANASVDKIGNDIGITAETIYGDQTAVEGISVGLSFETSDSLLWKSDVTFGAKNIDVNTDFTKGSFDTWDKIVSEVGIADEKGDDNDDPADHIRETLGKAAADIELEDGSVIVESEDEIILFNDKGFTVLKKDSENYSVALRREFTAEDSPAALGRWFENNPYRQLKTYYDGQRLAVTFRIAQPDPLYQSHKGTAVIVYTADGLEYIGVLGSELYDIHGVNASDYYAKCYELGQFVGVDIDVLVGETGSGSYYEPNEEYREVAERMEKEELAENEKYPVNDLFFNSGDGYYSIDYIRKAG